LPVQEMKYVERTNGMKSGPLCFAKYLIIWVLQFNLCPPQHTHLFHPLMSHPSFQILLSFFLSFFRSFVLSFFSDKYWYWILWHIITSDQFSSVYLFLLFVLLCMCVCVWCVWKGERWRENVLPTVSWLWHIRAPISNKWHVGKCYLQAVFMPSKS
jgi:hypothetical protein